MKKKLELTDKGKHLLVIMIIVCLGLMFLTMTSPRVAPPIRSGASIIVTPFQNGVNEIGKWLSGQFSGFRDVQKLSEENEELKAQVKGLEDAGLTGGFIPWNAVSSLDKYTQYKDVWNEEQ